MSEAIARLANTPSVEYISSFLFRTAVVTKFNDERATHEDILKMYDEALGIGEAR